MFQSSKFLENKNILIGKLKQDIANKIAANTDINTVKGESNYNELMTLIENSMFWKTGKYKGTIKVYTSENKMPSIKEINFTLSDVDIRNIKLNIELEKMLLERSYFPNQDGMNGRKWNWVNPIIS